MSSTASSRRANQDISQSTNKVALIACLAFSITFVLVRIAARWYKVRKIPLEAEDLSIYVAIASFATMSALYISAMPVLYTALAIAKGEEVSQGNLESALVSMLKKFFAVQFFFWLTLWAVKASLLFVIRKLTTDLPLYRKLWWIVMVFVVLTYFACAITQIESCASFHEWFTADACFTKRDSQAKAISLWFSLAMDILTDLMIMAIPIRLLWNLQMCFLEKFSLGIVFSVGIITMVFAIVRVVSLNISTSGGQVSTEWLILWAGIEGVVGILVGCLPAFAIFLRGRIAAARNIKYPPYSLSIPVTNSQSDGGEVSHNDFAARPQVLDTGMDLLDG